MNIFKGLKFDFKQPLPKKILRPRLDPRHFDTSPSGKRPSPLVQTSIQRVSVFWPMLLRLDMSKKNFTMLLQMLASI